MTRRRARRKPRRSGRRQPAKRSIRGPVDILEPDLAALRKQLERASAASGPPRWNADPEDVRRSVVKLVLTLVELLRKLMERQAIRRMEQAALTDEETEKLGIALMRLEETIREIAAQFDLRPEDLNLDLGPVGKLM
jgi:hypothetical protein